LRSSSTSRELGPDDGDAAGRSECDTIGAEVESRSLGERAAAQQTGHDLLVAMAGRLPDRLLWRLRDWLGAEAHAALRTALPRTLLRHRVGVTDHERALLNAVVTAWGGVPRLVDAVLRAEAAPEPAASFAPRREATGRDGGGGAGDLGGWDMADLVLGAVVPAFDEVRELRRTWRTDHTARRAAPVPPVRVVLVRAEGRCPDLAATVGRVLRAHGEVPCVEVVGVSTPNTAYHREAFAASEPLWVRTPRRPGPELVGHG